MTKLKQLLTLLYIPALLLVSLSPLLAPTPAAHAYSNSRMMDDQVFNDLGAMTPGNANPTSYQISQQVQSFFTGQPTALANGSTVTLAGGSTCLAAYQDSEPSWNGSAWVYGANTSVAKIIGDTAVQWGINPEVLISTLQKEESLVSGTSCDSWRYQSAMGYGCPDSGGCTSQYAGLTNQILFGGWQLEFGEQRSYGNTAWDGDGSITYSGFMTAGTFARVAGGATTSYNGYATIDGQSIYLEDGATASLYSYTPHLNQSFPGIFQTWFGDPTPSTSNPDAMSTSLYRLYNSKTDRHFYSDSISEVNAAMGEGYALEGVSMYISQDGGGDLTPVWRLYNKGSDYHFYTSNYAEAQADTSRGFVIEGIAFYASNGGDPGVTPVYRLLSRSTGTHFYTDDPTERDQAAANGYIYEGIAWYAVPY